MRSFTLYVAIYDAAADDQHDINMCVEATSCDKLLMKRSIKKITHICARRVRQRTPTTGPTLFLKIIMITHHHISTKCVRAAPSI